MKYCDKHKQKYRDFLDKCPICAGEEIGRHIFEKPEKTPVEKEREVDKNLKEALDKL